jgi:segregation and condensation protein B
MLNINDMVSCCEAILFASGEPVEAKRICEALEIEREELDKIMIMLRDRMEKCDSGLKLLKLENSYQLCTKEKYLPHIRVALGIRRSGTLSNSSIEVLAVIAYHQPVTRAYIDTVRGVDSAYAVTSLLERGLIESVGRLDAPGRPMLYGTTADFLRCFGLSSLSELPGVTSEEAADILARMRRSAMEPDVLENQISMEEGEMGAALFANDPAQEESAEK